MGSADSDQVVPMAQKLQDEMPISVSASQTGVDAAGLPLEADLPTAAAPGAEGDHLDHDIWEQAPKTRLEDLLHKGASAGLASLTAALLRQGASANGGFGKTTPGQQAKKDLRGVPPHIRHLLTPLHVATGNGHGSVVSTLLEWRADAMSKDRRGQTPLHTASDRSNATCARFLIDAGASLTAIDFTTRSTPLHIAAKSGNLAVEEVLIAELQKYEEFAKATIALDRWNRTPLHWSVAHGHVECCKALLAARASPVPQVVTANMPNRTKRSLERSYETPLQLAEKMQGVGSSPIRDVLQTYLVAMDK